MLPEMSKPQDRTVSKRPNGGWVNKKNSNKQVSSVHSTQADAVNAAKVMLKNQGGGELMIKGLDGKIRSKNTIKALHKSTNSLNRSYQSLEKRESEFENIPFGNQFLNLSKRENANSLAALNALESNEPGTSLANDEDIMSTTITSELCSISTDLESRWKGALFSLNPRNPEASRHFCTSAREVYIQILDHFAPDEKVLSRFPGCDKNNSLPTRRWKIKFILLNSGISSDGAVDFVDEDINNVLQLFRVLNDGTHGSAGKFEFAQLRTIKERVESGIIYLTTISRIAKHHHSPDPCQHHSISARLLAGG
jgi:hypothetical protein